MNETQNATAENLIEFPTPPAGIDKPSESKWVKSKFSNLWRYTPTDMYYVRAKVNGSSFSRCLDTRSLEIAKIKMDKMLSGERGKPTAEVCDEDLTFRQLADEYITHMKSNPDTKPRSVDYRLETLIAIRKTWPKIDSLKPSDFTDDTMLSWASRLRGEYSATRYNGAIQTMRAVMQVACDRGLLRENPARSRNRNSTKGIPMASVKLTPPQLPESDKFQVLLKHLDSLPSRANAANMVRFLAYSGCRIGAARLVRPEHVDFARNEILIPAIKYDTQPNRVPMIGEMKSLCEKLIADYPGFGPLLQIANPRKALSHCCRDAGITTLTNHDLRHLFTTRCMEQGVELKCLAQWLGHKDGGRLILSRYAHLRNEHSQSMAAKVTFITPQ